MSLRKVSSSVVPTTLRLFCESAKSAGPAEVSKKDDYYKTLGQRVDESRPADWDGAGPYEEIPGPRPLPVVGNLWRFMPVIGELNKIPVRKMLTLFKERYGNVVVFKGIPGWEDFLYIFDPKDMENIFRNSGAFPERHMLQCFVHYRTVIRKDIFQGVGGVLTVQGADWFQVRSMVNPILMQPRTVREYISKIEKIAADLVDNMVYFSKLHENRQMPENFANELHKWALESVGVIALNKNFGCLDLKAPEDAEATKLVSAVLTMFDHLYLLEMHPPFWKYIYTPLFRKFVKNMDFITSLIMNNIDSALSELVNDSVSEHQLSVLQRLAKKDKMVAFAMVMDLMIAGIDSTGKTLATVLYFLAKNPDKQAKLRKEIVRNLPEKDSPITGKVLGDSPYLKAVIRESNRIAPIAIASMRTTVIELVLGGYQIPKGTDVAMVTIETSNSSTYFKDPEKYLPERWLRETNDEYSAKHAHPFASLPFGFGSRSCVGMRFATLELEVALIKIIRNLELSWEHPDMEFTSKFLYGINDPLKITVKEFNL